MSHAGQTAHRLVNISIALPLKSNTPYLKWTWTMSNYVHLLTDPRTTGISHFKEKGVITLKPAPRHLHWFLFKHLSKESLQFCPTDLFQRTQSKVNYAASQVPELHSNQLILSECSIPRSLCQICAPDIKLVPKAYGLWLIALIYCVKVSINWSCHFVVNITKKEILNGCVRSSIWPLKSVNLSHV